MSNFPDEQERALERRRCAMMNHQPPLSKGKRSLPQAEPETPKMARAESDSNSLAALGTLAQAAHEAYEKRQKQQVMIKRTHQYPALVARIRSDRDKIQALKDENRAPSPSRPRCGAPSTRGGPP